MRRSLDASDDGDDAYDSDWVYRYGCGGVESPGLFVNLFVRRVSLVGMSEVGPLDSEAAPGFVRLVSDSARVRGRTSGSGDGSSTVVRRVRRDDVGAGTIGEP